MALPRERSISPEEYLEIDRASDIKYEYDSGHIALYRLTDVPEQEAD